MSSQLPDSIPATYKHNAVNYSFLKADAGAQRVLSNDPWAFLNSQLRNKLSGTRGVNKENIERAIYYSSLAEDFYRCAESIPLPASGTLLYYGMLDLVKCFLSVNGVQLEAQPEHHGLTLLAGEERTIEVKGRLKNCVNIFYEFAHFLGKPVTRSSEHRLEQLLSHVPEIHGIYSSLGHIKKRKLLPVDISFITNEKRDKLFTKIQYSKNQKTKVQAEHFYKGNRKTYFREALDVECCFCFVAKRRKSVTLQNFHRIYRNIISDYEKFDIVPLLTSEGYRYYVDLRPGELSHLSYTLAAMFYLGSAARYRPLEIKSVLEGDLRPLVSEFVSLAPKQFLYQMVSRITNRECVIPLAAL